MTWKITVASLNPVKIQAAQAGFAALFPELNFTASGISVPSGVSDQPMTSAETLRGALQRCENARLSQPDSDYWVGIEGGVEEEADGQLATFAWVVVQNLNQTGKGRSATFYLPAEVARLVHEGKELGEADDIVFSRSNSKQENGAVGLLTGNAIDRSALYQPAVIMALIPFKNPHLYPSR